MREIDSPAAFAEAFSVSRETLERLKTYEALLQQWQKPINLVAPGTLETVWHRHFADSAQLLALAPPEPKTWLDLGSGAGFPGLVVAILLAGSDRDPETPAGPAVAKGRAAKTRVTLVESDSRKAAFLRETARKVAVPVDIVAGRIEAAATRANLRHSDVISARALAPLPRLIGLAMPFVGPKTMCLFPKGREAGRELQTAELQWNFTSELVPSLTEPEARIAVLKGCKPKL